MQLARRETRHRAPDHASTGPCPACSRGKNGKVECAVRTGRVAFRCPSCSYAAQLVPDEDDRNCRRCGALMRAIVKAARVARDDGRRYNPDTVQMPPVWRCQACGGLHWHVLALVKICPVTGR